MNIRDVNSVIVLGGGTAGWVASLYMSDCFSKAQVTVVESEKIGILGAGEGTFRNFKYFLDRFGLDEAEFMDKTDATYKLGIEYLNWRYSRHVYYHYFMDRPAFEARRFTYDGADRFLSYLLARRERIDTRSDFHAMRLQNVSQSDVRSYMAANADVRGLRIGYHFDAHRVAAYLRAKALERPNIRRVEGVVDEVYQDQDGIRSLQLDEGQSLTADFFVDASGFRRLMVGAALGAEWTDYSDHLLVDGAMPFILPASTQNPELVTQAVAMDCGWMWRIPTSKRMGCGYVFSSRHLDFDSARQEVQTLLKREIEPIGHIRFKPGALDTVWVKNCLAVGLAAGFLEPLEATSIGQTISQLEDFRTIAGATGGIVPTQQIKSFNRRTKNSFELTRDFLVMHYINGRRDTAFWRDVAATEMPDTVDEMLGIFASRTPRATDGWFGYEKSQVYFPTSSYFSVCGALDLLSVDAAKDEVANFRSDDIAELERFRLTRQPQPGAALAV